MHNDSKLGCEECQKAWATIKKRVPRSDDSDSDVGKSSEAGGLSLDVIQFQTDLHEAHHLLNYWLSSHTNLKTQLNYICIAYNLEGNVKSHAKQKYNR